MCCSLWECCSCLWPRPACSAHEAHAALPRLPLPLPHCPLLPVPPQPGCSGFGIVRFPTKEAAELAVNTMNNTTIGGRVVSVRIDRFA